MDSGAGQSSEAKRKSPSDATGIKKEEIPFRVFWHKVGFDQPSLKLAKLDVPTWDKTVVLRKDYPNVCAKVVNAGNKHAIHIMHNLNHKNIMHIRALGTSKLQKGDELSAFIMMGNANLRQENLRSVFVSNEFMPSKTFQDVLKEIIDGLDYLWRSGTYHGNLSWTTTYFEHPYTVKLYGFTLKAHIPLEEAQWQDWDAIVAMLEEVVAEAASRNALPNNSTIVYDDLEALIATMKASARVNVNPLPMRGSISEEVFFWKTRDRAKFCMITIHKLFNNDRFSEAVNNSSICPDDWYCKTKTENLTYFEQLVKYCNNYHQKLPHPLPIFNEKSKMDFLRFLYAAYTHRSQIKDEEALNVDDIIHQTFPRLFLKLNRIVKRFVN